MKWVNHEIVTFSVAFAVSGNLPFSVASTFFATAPDLIEGGRNIKVLEHRGMSHNPLTWVAFCAALAIPTIALRENFNNMLPAFLGLKLSWNSLLLWLDIALATGALTHLMADALTITGIPLLPGKRLALKLFKTGSITEYILSYGLLIAVIAIRAPMIFQNHI